MGTGESKSWWKTSCCWESVCEQLPVVQRKVLSGQYFSFIVYFKYSKEVASKPEPFLSSQLLHGQTLSAAGAP